MNKTERLFVTECPRDAMQGIKEFIPTDIKVRYLNALLKVGFRRIDFGSFVSAAAIPQMKDTAEVLGQLDLRGTESSLLAIVANVKGASLACSHEQIGFLGYPFSISETFQKRNANSTIAESLIRVKEIKKLAEQNGKSLLVYISMAFGNPYGDPWSESLTLDWCRRMAELGIRDIALADTTGSSDISSIRNLFGTIIPSMSEVEITAHLHSTPDQSRSKIKAAFESGCRSFDTAILGFGGCPMATDELTGNMATEIVVGYAQEIKVETGLHSGLLNEATAQSRSIFNRYH
jgi:hydroxymethylglutaryl-CoA lyase